MTTVVSRTVRAVPFRSARETWQLIIEMLTARDGGAYRAELESVVGISAAMITEKALAKAPLILLGGGPRVRVYCLYDEDALEGDTQNEAGLSFDAFAGDWSLSIPCPAADLTWVTEALKKKSPRIRARDAAEGIDVSGAKSRAAPLELNLTEFMKP